jgi:hypothetical protein
MIKRKQSGGDDSPGKGGRTKMAENEKNIQKEDRSCCGGAFFTAMKRKMPEGKKSGLGFDCAQRISLMMPMCCGSWEKKEEAKANPAPNP